MLGKYIYTNRNLVMLYIPEYCMYIYICIYIERDTFYIDVDACLVHFNIFVIHVCYIFAKCVYVFAIFLLLDWAVM